jgi:hypothetical protein
VTRTLTDAVIETLEDGGLTVGDATGQGLTAPYVVVFPIAGETYDGTIGPGGTWTEIDKPFQPTCVGVTREQAEWLADRVRTLLLTPHADYRARPIGGGGTVRDDATGSPALCYAYPRFSMTAWI